MSSPLNNNRFIALFILLKTNFECLLNYNDRLKSVLIIRAMLHFALMRMTGSPLVRGLFPVALMKGSLSGPFTVEIPKLAENELVIIFHRRELQSQSHTFPSFF